MSVQNKVNFTVTIGTKEVPLAVVRPNVRQREEAQIAYSQAFASLLKQGLILNAALETELRNQNIWNDAKQAEYDAIRGRLEANTKIVTGLVKGVSLGKAREAAIAMRRDRLALRELTADRYRMESNTVEGQAENARFNYLVARCTIYASTGERYFKDIEDFKSREDDPVTLEAANRFASIYYTIDPDFEKNLPENKFLVQYKFADQKLRLINKDGHFCDPDGRLINEDGRYVNEAGEYVDSDGNRVTKEGEPLVEHFEFLDDDGKPVDAPSSETPAEPKLPPVNPMELSFVAANTNAEKAA